MAVSSAAFGVAAGFYPICTIVIAAIFLYKLTVKTEQFNVIRDSISSITSDPRLQVLLIAVLVSLAMVSYSDDKPKNVKTITKISINQVATVPGLTGALYSQVSPSILKHEKQASYHAIVILNNRAYYVFGRFQDWKEFFKVMPVPAQPLWKKLAP